MRSAKIPAAAVALSLVAGPAFASEGGLPGDAMSLIWAVPFAGLLLSIATGPLQVRITALGGATLMDTLPEPTGGLLVAGTGQFP